MLPLPKVFRVRQRFDAPRIENVEREVERQLGTLRLGEKIGPGQSVAITAGSRGITNIPRIIRAIAGHLSSLGAKPFIVPAMGSHGGGTAEGQRQLIEGYGITEEFCGCPIKSSLETVVVCHTTEGLPVHFDRHAFEADHVVVCGRVKPHTDFVGEVESGLLKMLMIGLGKHAGAKVYHRAIHDLSFSQIVNSVGCRLLECCRIVAGVAIVENGYDETALVEAVAPQKFIERERDLLRIARTLMPRLPFDFVHLLLVDEIGKNISGTGMDTNIIGRKFNDHKAVDGEKPVVRRIAVRSLTEATHGNASGIGIAEFCLRRVLDQTDFAATRVNCLTAGHISAAMIPLDYATDRALLEAALPTVGRVEPEGARVLWIRNTLELGEVECSAAYFDEAQKRTDLEILCEPRELPLDAQGNLPAAGMATLSGV